MSRIRSKDTKPELLVRKFLFSQGFRYRLHNKKVPGNPDIVFAKHKLAIFIHGCFWHGHKNCSNASTPKSNTGYWVPKIERNMKRDEVSAAEIKKLGWNMITVWECELSPKVIHETLDNLLNKLNRIKKSTAL